MTPRGASEVNLALGCGFTLALVVGLALVVYLLAG